MSSVQFNKATTFADSLSNDKQFKSSLNGLTGTTSLVNKFSMFRYHKYGTSKTTYNDKYHFDVSNTDRAKTNDVFALAASAAVSGLETIINNPTASAIINWSKQSNSVFGPAPYSITDFIYCKYYGLIPNNRLITLRRFPMPVHDNMRGHGNTNLVPLAQAVTWFSESTKNSLKAVIPHLSWDMPWEQINAQDGQQDYVTLENVTAQELLNFMPDLAGKLGKAAVGITKILQAAGSAVEGNTKMAEINGSYQQLTDYNKNLYNSTGPKWNEKYGGTNYITQQLIRSEMSKATSWAGAKSEVKFHYSLKSFAGVKPKIALLDVISNFLALTYMNMEFKGSFARFIPTPGVTGYPGIDAQITRLFFDNKPAEAMRLAAAIVGIQMAAGASAIETLLLNDPNVASKLANDDGSVQVAVDKSGKKLTVDQLLASVGAISKNYRNIAKKPFTMRAKLSGEAVGEWHLVVGNPMEPIATIGNLVCTGCTMEFGDELGPDDFPTEVIFTVSLKPGQPRDKFGIESMFNLGGGSLTEFSSNPPSSNFNTLTPGDQRPGNQENTVLKERTALQGNNVLYNPTEINQGMYMFTKDRIKKSYGVQYANLTSLPVYFMTQTGAEGAIKVGIEEKKSTFIGPKNTF